jgi:hypothetical protein
MIKVENIPIMETIEIEYKAGCFAKIKTPIPSNVVITESKIAVLCVINALVSNASC